MYSGFLPAVPFARTDLFFSLPVLTRVIKLEMFWVLSIWLLIKTQMSHVYHKMFPQIKQSIHLQIISKKYPARARRFNIAGTGSHRHIQRTANSKFRMNACMILADSIGHTANPCIVVYV